MMHVLHVKHHWILKFDTSQSCVNVAVILSLDFMHLDGNKHLFPALQFFSLSVCSIKCKWKDQNSCFQDAVAHDALAC